MTDSKGRYAAAHLPFYIFIIFGIIPSDGMRMSVISDVLIFSVAVQSHGWQQINSSLRTFSSIASETLLSLSKIRLVMLNEPGDVPSMVSIFMPLAKESLDEPRAFETSFVTNFLLLSIMRR